ncbi:MAG: RluA family pseudouridine synthase, partial [Hyphomicrobiaceae bacterium]
MAGPDDDGQRLDRFLTDRLTPRGLSRVRVQAVIRAGHVAAESGGTLVDPGARVKSGDRMRVRLPAAAPAEPTGEDIPLNVVFEDEHVIVIDKPAGLVVHPAAGHSDGTLVNALIAHCGDSLSGIGGVKRPGIVHRLDKDTSGLLVVAKTDKAHRALAEQFASHGADGRLERVYHAIVWGRPARSHGSIDAPLARSSSNRTKIAVSNAAGARRAVTHYEVLESWKGEDGKALASLLACRLDTGRTHQIRVHLAHIGHPLLGDRSYGSHFSASARRMTA